VWFWPVTRRGVEFKGRFMATYLTRQDQTKMKTDTFRHCFKFEVFGTEPLVKIESFACLRVSQAGISYRLSLTL